MNDPAREAQRWILQAADDLKFVLWIRDEGVFFDKGCFLAQQAGEKALKACLYAVGRRRVIGHSLLEMAMDLCTIPGPFPSLLDSARRLDRFYITARYPNGLPGGSPYQAFVSDDLHRAAADAAIVVEAAFEFLRSRGIPVLPSSDSSP
ncbi:MAG: HEPN domain-containing protein [Deferrisomatales bacterium]